MGGRRLGGHGEHSCDSESDSCGGGAGVYPEGDPTETDDEQGGNVGLDDVVAGLSLQPDQSLHTGVLTRAVVPRAQLRPVGLYEELRQLHRLFDRQPLLFFFVPVEVNVWRRESV